jgi:hypothetical protein
MKGRGTQGEVDHQPFFSPSFALPLQAIRHAWSAILRPPHQRGVVPRPSARGTPAERRHTQFGNKAPTRWIPAFEFKQNFDSRRGRPPVGRQASFRIYRGRLEWNDNGQAGRVSDQPPDVAIGTGVATTSMDYQRPPEDTKRLRHRVRCAGHDPRIVEGGNHPWRVGEVHRGAEEARPPRKEAPDSKCEPNRALDERYHHPRRVDTLGEVSGFAVLVPAPRRGPLHLNLEVARRR